MIIVPRADPASVGTNSTQPTRIVLVDRQPLFLAALSRLLAGPPLDAVVETTTEMAFAAQALEAGRADLVLAEVTAGVEELVRQGIARGVPVVLLGDDDAQPSPARALKAGAAGLFPKDASPDEFLAGVAAVRAGHRALGSRLLQDLIDNVVAQASPAAEPPAVPLSPTERRVLAMLASGMSVREVAEARTISAKTVRKHLVSIYRKLRVRSRSEAVLWAARSHLTAD